MATVCNASVLVPGATSGRVVPSALVITAAVRSAGVFSDEAFANAPSIGLIVACTPSALTISRVPVGDCRVSTIVTAPTGSVSTWIADGPTM